MGYLDNKLLILEYKNTIYNELVITLLRDNYFIHYI